MMFGEVGVDEKAGRKILIAPGLFRSQNLEGFQILWLTIGAFFAINLFLFTLTSANSSLMYNLALTPDQPFGILTANFVHRDAAHISGNLLIFALMGIFFASVNMFSGLERRRRMSKIFCLVSILAGLVAYAVQFGAWKAANSSGVGVIGASGMVYGAIGISLVSAFYNLPGHMRRAHIAVHPQHVCSNWNSKACAMWRVTLGADSPGMLFFVLFFSAFIVASFALMILLQPASFFYTSPGVAWFTHGTSFIIGMLLAAFAVLMILCIESWNRCGCLFCCIPKEGVICDIHGHELDSPVCKTS